MAWFIWSVISRIVWPAEISFILGICRCGISDDGTGEKCGNISHKYLVEAGEKYQGPVDYLFA